MDEAVARAIELSVRGGDVDLGGLGNDVEGLVGDMEALRQGLEEADRAAPGSQCAPSDAEVTTGGLVRSSAVVGIGTGLSRVTGLFRTVALTYALGATVVADGYNLANTTPNIVYDLLLGGVLSATLVPVFVDRFEHDDDEGVSAVVTITVAVLVALTVVAVLAAPLIFKLYTWDKTGIGARSRSAPGVPAAVSSCRRCCSTASPPSPPRS